MPYVYRCTRCGTGWLATVVEPRDHDWAVHVFLCRRCRYASQPGVPRAVEVGADALPVSVHAGIVPVARLTGPAVEALRMEEIFTLLGLRPNAPVNAFKRAPSLEVSTWYMGSLTTNLADKHDTNGAFTLVEATLAPGHEPPPHVHAREDELFYVLDGAFDVYVGADAFTVATGECIFLPKGTPHAFVIRSPRLRLLTLFTPGGLEDAFRGLSAPAQRLDLPTGALTYATADVTQTAQRLGAYGVRLLTPEEVAAHLPGYPQALPSTPARDHALERRAF